MRVALTCPDSLSVLLFCQGIIEAIQDGGRSHVVVITDVGESREALEALGVTCIDRPVSRFTDPAGDIGYIADLVRLFRQHRCDAVLNFSTKQNIYGAIAGSIAGLKPIVAHVVGLGTTFVPDPSFKAAAMRRVLRGLYRIACRLSDKVWFTNPNDRQFFIETGLVAESRTILTRNYLDTSFWAIENEAPGDLAALRVGLGYSPDDIVVLMVARLNRAKGVFDFAEAAMLLRERCPGCRFLLVAPAEPPGAQTVSVEEVRAFEALGNFRWMGFQRDVRRLYAMCDMAVLPTYYKEGGYPRSLLEPMSLGKPLITTTSEDCRKTVDEGRNGFLVPPQDPTALADAIEQLAADPELRAQFGRWSRKKAVEEFEERAIVGEALRKASLVRA